MKKLIKNISMILVVVFVLSSCASMNKTQKGGAVGTASGGAMGAIIGRASGNTALGAIIGAAVGGTTGAVIGHQMDKQAEDIKNTVPDAKVERVGEGIVVEFSSKVLFAYDKSSLSDQSKVNLNKLVIVLNNYPDTDIELQGHTDSKGTEAYNRKLSISRANAVRDYLSAKGISNRRMAVKGFGESYPKYSNETEDGRSQNRRVEFLITANEQMKAEAERKAGS